MFGFEASIKVAIGFVENEYIGRAMDAPAPVNHTYTQFILEPYRILTILVYT